MNTSSFFAFAFRMKYINRWGLMKNSRYETLTEHSAETAMLAHFLALCGNRLYGRKYDAERVALFALYHDVSEIITGDLPTPVKYYNRTLRESYREIEEHACEELLNRLPEEFREDYAALLREDCTPEEKRIVKAADKLSALIKCTEEVKNGTTEFIKAKESTVRAVHEMHLPEADYFLENMLPAFSLTLDEL